jgi:hypothetical protein
MHHMSVFFITFAPKIILFFKFNLFYAEKNLFSDVHNVNTFANSYGTNHNFKYGW